MAVVTKDEMKALACVLERAIKDRKKLVLKTQEQLKLDGYSDVNNKFKTSAESYAKAEDLLEEVLSILDRSF